MIELTIRTISQIIEEMRAFQISRYPQLSTQSPTSILMMLNESVANQIRKLEVFLEKEINNLNIYTAEGDALEALIINWLPEGRLHGSFAEGVVTFYCSDLITEEIHIPKNTRVAAVSKTNTLYFETTEDAYIHIGGTQAAANVKAVAPGTIYNVAPHTVTYLPVPIPGIQYITNHFSFSGGEDEETDEQLRRRYIYAIKTAGKATTLLISHNLEAVAGITQTLCYTWGPGDLQIICDAPDVLGDNLSKIIEENIAAGVVGCGCVSGQIIGGSANPKLAETWGGNLWVRPKNIITTQEQITGTCLSQSNSIINYIVTIPAGSVPGSAIKATLSQNTYVKNVESITYSGNSSYDLLIGLGVYPHIWLKPKEIGVDIQITIRKEPTFESSLEWKIEQSVSNFIASLKIGDDLEFSDLVRAVFKNTLPPYQTFEGIDEIVTCLVVGKGQNIGSFGNVLQIAPDEKILLSSISVESI